MSLVKNFFVMGAMGFLYSVSLFVTEVWQGVGFLHANLHHPHLGYHGQYLLKPHRIEGREGLDLFFRRLPDFRHKNCRPNIQPIALTESQTYTFQSKTS